jgi:bacteriocin biosynthesis cyclodehydratase domain-containing protein
VTTDRGPPSNGGPQFRLRPSVEAFVDRHGALCFVRAGASDLIVRAPDPHDVALVDRLQRGPQTVRSLSDGLGLDPSAIGEKLASLEAAGLVLVREPAAQGLLAGEDMVRFDRQLGYFAELGDEVRLQRRLRDSRVVVIGCGGIGTWVVAALACVGVGRIELVDDDRVALSNLNRQILYARHDVGTLKVSAAASWLHAFDPAIEVTVVPRRVERAADVPALVAGADVVILAADSPPYDIARWVNAACIDAVVPFAVAGQVPPMIKVGPTYSPGDGPCFACHETAVAAGSSGYEDYVAFSQSRPANAMSTVGPASCVAGGLLGLDVMHLLLGRPPATRGAAIMVHMDTLETRREAIPRDPACAACHHLADGRVDGLGAAHAQSVASEHPAQVRGDGDEPE